MSFDIDGFIDGCQQALASPEPMGEVRALMTRALADVDAVHRAVPSHSGEPSRILHRADDLTVLQVSLPPGLKSPVHNHTLWAVIGIYQGQENNRFFVADDELRQHSERQLKAGDVAALDEDTIHAIENPLDTVTLGLHVYGGDLIAARREVWDPATGQREPFTADRFAEISREVNQVTAP